ncbi:MAG: secondary thiamine-phosphate synthase enzyme YjbQ [Prevotella sp.]|nr:secondary thiamine-phosphate synthase enzyme YjbQ [Prevotella sp.]MDD7606591.1 secondary thiamine-phosphate synthase enzyme YjbQ [Prevotellaceae bacterium]MDY3246943.1 secondary thiamine-phosphate synthase enzyme YjbQ [Prevotella sp.]
MARQYTFALRERPRGCHIITSEVLQHIPDLPQVGVLHLFVQHTSCALSVCENWDSSVRSDMTAIYNHLVPENQPYYDHVLEGADDMPAHAKSILTGVSVSIPIAQGQLCLGTWQGVYLCEFRNHGGPRHIVATIIE